MRATGACAAAKLRRASVKRAALVSMRKGEKADTKTRDPSRSAETGRTFTVIEVARGSPSMRVLLKLRTFGAQN